MRSLLLIVSFFLTPLFFIACTQQALPVGGAGTPAPGSYQGQGNGQGQRNGQSGGQGNFRRATTIAVQALTARVENLSADRVTSGVVIPVTQSQVAAQGSGVVLRVLKQAGSWVNREEVVIQLDDAQQKLSLATAQANYENAKINLAIGMDASTQANPKLDLQVQSAQSALDSAQKNYESQKALFELGGASAASVDTSLSGFKQAQANLAAANTALDQNRHAGTQTLAQLKLSVDQALNQLNQAQLNLRNMMVRAPFSGQISVITANPGMYVGTNTTAFTLVSAEKQISFNVAPSEGPAVLTAKDLQFSYKGKNFPLHLGVLPSSPVNGMIPLTGSINDSAQLPFGAIGTISYSVQLATGVVVPIAALESLENRIFVFTIVDGKVVSRFVTVVAETGNRAALNGIEGGTVVIVNAPPGLIEKASVQALLIDQLPAINQNTTENVPNRRQGSSQRSNSQDQGGGKTASTATPGKRSWPKKPTDASPQTENQ